MLARQAEEKMKSWKESQGVQLNVIFRVYKTILELTDGGSVMGQKFGL